MTAEISLFLTRVLLNDLFSIGMLPVAEGLVFMLLYISLLRLDVNSIASAFIALIFTEVTLVLLCVQSRNSLSAGSGESITRRRSGPGSTSPTSSHRTASLSGAERRWHSAPGRSLRIQFYGGWDAGSASEALWPNQCSASTGTL